MKDEIHGDKQTADSAEPSPIPYALEEHYFQEYEWLMKQRGGMLTLYLWCCHGHLYGWNKFQ